MKKFIILFTVFIIATCAFIPRPYTYDINKANDFITQHAQHRSKGLCAQYVRKALEAGGCCTWGHPFTAKGYYEFLTALDFSKIPQKGYSPKKGDIVVFNATKGHPYGHIAIWNGKQWVSDFLQNNFYVAHNYKQANDYQVFRMDKDTPKRHFTLFHHLKGLCVLP